MRARPARFSAPPSIICPSLRRCAQPFAFHFNPPFLSQVWRTNVSSRPIGKAINLPSTNSRSCLLPWPVEIYARQGVAITVSMEGSRQLEQPPHELDYSVTARSETPDASSDVSSSHPFPSLPDASLDTVPALPSSSSRNTRKLTINSSIARSPPPATHLIRRKPLSSSASPVATRYSSGGYLSIAQGLVRPETRYSRSFSVDSPTVYDFQFQPIATIETIAGLGSPKPKLATPNELEVSSSNVG